MRFKIVFCCLIKQCGIYHTNISKGNLKDIRLCEGLIYLHRNKVLITLVQLQIKLVTKQTPLQSEILAFNYCFSNNSQP